MISDWDNLRVFLALAEEGSLSAAAKRLKVSHPTIARRIKALEEDLGARLFERLPDRFQPTEQALELLHDVKAMEAASESVQRRSLGLSGNHLGTVRISVDETIADFLARHVGEIRSRNQCIEIELAVAHISANLSRREADLLVRSRVPDVASLVGRKLGTFGFAVYGNREMAERRRELAMDGDGTAERQLKELPWIGFDEDHQYMPGQDWQARLLGNHKPGLRTNNGVALATAIRHGAGVGVLPCFMGDPDPDLHRLTDPIEECRTPQWLLVHGDLRQVPRIRIVMDELIRLFQGQRAAIEGVEEAAGSTGPELVGVRNTA